MPLFNVTLYPTVILRFGQIEAQDAYGAAEIAETRYFEDPEEAIRTRLSAPDGADDWIEVDASEPRVSEPLVDLINEAGDILAEDVISEHGEWANMVRGG